MFPKQGQLPNQTKYTGDFLISLNKRGQESAPFELLVAVIIMGFVIFVGMNAMEMMRVEQCHGKIDQKLEEFKTRLQITVNSKSPQSINFTLPTCFSSKTEEITIDTMDDAKACASYCQSVKQSCNLLFYSNAEFSIRKCLDISPSTFFPMDGSKCPTLQDFPEAGLVNLNEGSIPQGRYTFVNKTPAIASFPTICAYVRG